MKNKELEVPIMYDCEATDMIAGNLKRKGGEPMNRRPVSVYTDGSCNGNPGPGGWAAILKKGRWEREIVGSTPYGSNNRMELQAVIAGLSAVRPGSLVTVYTDSGYVERAVNEGRLAQWQNNGWRRIRTLEPVMNADLWRYYLSIVQERKLEVKFEKLTAHQGHKLNNRADFLARQAAKTA